MDFVAYGSEMGIAEVGRILIVKNNDNAPVFISSIGPALETTGKDKAAHIKIPQHRP
jgi:hypothetical protein